MLMCVKGILRGGLKVPNSYFLVTMSPYGAFLQETKICYIFVLTKTKLLTS